MSGFLVNTLDATVLAGATLLLAALGELVSERSGVLNLGIEGIMLVGALTGFAVTVVTSNPYLGVLAAMVAGVGISVLHAFLTVTLKSDHVISGIMVTLLGTGLTTYFGQNWVSHSINGFSSVYVPVVGPYLVETPVVGEALFYNTPTTYLAFLMVPTVWFFLTRTNLGLELVAAGEDPETADTMAVNVTRMRYLGVLLSGALAGIAGAHLSLAYSVLWSSQMTGGRGWIAVALVVFSHWRPLRLALGAGLFAVIEAIALRIQGTTLELGAGIPLSETINGVLGVLLNPTVMGTYPYLVTIIVLVYATSRQTDQYRGMPDALLEHYSRKTD